MEYPDAERLFRYWNIYPPDHLLLRAYIGFEPAEERARRPENILAQKALLKMAQQQGGVIPARDLPEYVKQFIAQEQMN